MKKIIWVMLILLGAGGALGYTFLYRGKEPAAKYRTAKVERGNISAYVTANGTVNPVITVLVGSQVSGMIQKLYADYNSQVKKGQLIAQIDPALFQAQVSLARAKVENAKAAFLTVQADIATARSNVESSKANTLKARVTVQDAQRTLNRSLELFARNLISASDRDTAQTSYDSAVALLEAATAQEKASHAQLESVKAKLEAARAAIKQAEAELETAQVNLDHTRITAPVTGIVISRNVDVGQTVAASLQAPTLFTIAQDLTQMQVDTNVSEADVGRVAVGQDATFTVDAFPQSAFRGRVSEIRNAPLTVQNVVTYDVVILVKNPDLKLRPGMTANASILVAQKENVLKIPNAALRFRPDFARKSTPGKPAAPPSGAAGRGAPNLERLKAELNLTPEQEAQMARLQREMQGEAQAARKAGPEEAKAKIRDLRTAGRKKIRAILSEEQRQKYDRMLEGPQAQNQAPAFKIWVPAAQGRPDAVEITTGISDGTYTEVFSGGLKEGQEIIVEALGSSKSNAAQTGPSMRGFR